MSKSTNYREIKADILQRITGGYWPPGTLLPGEHALAGEYAVARATVSRALRELSDDGIIERKRKAGTRVRPRPLRRACFDIPPVRSEIEDKGWQYGYRLLQAGVEPAPPEAAQQLGMGIDTPAIHVACIHAADARPHQFEDRWINPQTAPGAADADFSTDPPLDWLSRALPYTTVQIALMAAVADAELAEASR